MDDDYEPNEIQEQILDALKAGRDEGEPWGRVTPRYLREEIGLPRQNLDYHLSELVEEAEWVRKPVKGMYVFVGDPRDGE